MASEPRLRTHGFRAAETEVIKLGALRLQARFNVAQALAPSQLGEGQTQKLIKTRQDKRLTLCSPS
jgi:hypothetical protein